jgi:hypothetical protein
MQTATRGTSQGRNRNGAKVLLWLAALSVAMPAAVFAGTFPASALSEIKREQLPTEPAPSIPGEDAAPENSVPSPDPLETNPPAAEEPATQEPDIDEPGAAEPNEPPANGPAAPQADETDAPIPEILYDLTKLPEPVQRMRQLILDATKTGDLEKLRPLIGTGDDATQLSLGGLDGDPIAFLKEQSGDKDGQEILAIIENILNAGYVHIEPGTSEEIYAWPYFFAVPLEKLDPRQRVELFKIVTAGDYEEMKTYGVYNFYRLAITPEGKWVFFVAGD